MCKRNLTDRLAEEMIEDPFSSEEQAEEDEMLGLYTCTDDSAPVIMEVKINGVPVSMEVDTGSGNPPTGIKSGVHAERKSGGGRGYGGGRDGGDGGGGHYSGRGGGRHNSGECNSYSGGYLSHSGGDGSSYGKYGGHRDYD
uniref:uncharacterized protein n=1 Tax=Pristiophorus japonicus TaxID=55135 RepID=UPI00398EE4D8